MTAIKTPGVLRSLTVCRFVGENQPEIADFSSQFGRALRGKGSTRSLGSMALTSLPAGCTNNSLYPQTRSKRAHKSLPPRPDEVAWLDERLQKVFKDRPRTFSVPIEGIGVKGGDGMTRSALVFILGQCAQVDEDTEQINEVFEERGLPKPLKNNDPHITFGEVYLRQLVRGEGEDPYMLMPKRLCVPDSIIVHGLSVEALSS